MKSFKFIKNWSLTIILFATISLSIRANNYPAIHPNNMNEVVAQIYMDYASQIQITQDDIITFLEGIQTNYNPDLAIPSAMAVNGGPTFIKFEMSSPNTYTGGYLNLDNGTSNVDDFTGLTHTFDGLAGQNLHLFAFVSTDVYSQSSIFVVLQRPVELIIIDIKVNYNDECSTLMHVVTGTPWVLVPLLSGNQKYYQVRISNAFSIDTFIIQMENINGNISGGLIDPNQVSLNRDNYITGILIASTRPLTRSIKFIKMQSNSSNLGFDSFKIIDNAPQVFLPINIQVFECKGVPNSMMNLDDEVVASENTQKAEMLSLFPNPVVETAQINLPDIDLQGAQLIISNSKGQVVGSRQDLPNNATHVVVDLSKLSSGLYIVQLKTNNKIYYGRVIKTNP